ncbi:MAG: LL-diaminopimelate aminotransferase [Deltaproteobacteria bacterium CG_4_10_14_0_2_um_filter_43_8]|nr:MAG: LL-diaminopimelate aminotransferase [Deltaproteobacteria bacterium CG11_big_fil_rev_8_21_14_0_20_42_23]PJA18709.1 MAG: LL-diaminopimelate aminotransferase [Deltaproteobacteria bacterium CG_4_10_14_0_2_um_filter_43_8]PJC64727.1 MAG: LL-diaminopimelate aminotransferase [Deltaproteobacteria bacterium CG_4_9_14_0_2_um_filter_42_21]
MEIKVSKRLAALTGYAFAEVDKKVAELKEQGINPIDFGVGDPSEPTPEIIRAALKEASDVRKSAGYPSYIGSLEYREAIAKWTKARFGVELNPKTEIASSVGSKEAVFNFAEAFVNPGDVVIVPNPGYPPYTRGTQFAEGEVYYVNLLPENNFLPKLDEIPEDICKRAKIMWVNYPNNPTGVLASRAFYEELVAFGKKHNIIIASDEPYTENYFGTEKPLSILEIAKEGVVVFQSLSKRSCMTCYRIGWCAGDARIIDAFKKLKTNVDSGAATFIQDAAIAALSDEKHVEELRALYRTKRDIIVEAFVDAGLPECKPEATLYMWQPVPKGMTSVEFAQKLLDPNIAMVTTPGNWVSSEVRGVNPGEGFVRLALVPSVEECKEAAKRIKTYLKDR